MGKYRRYSRRLQQAAQKSAGRVVYYSALAEQVLENAFGAARASWITRLEQEHPNLRALLQRLVDRGAAEPGLRLALLLAELWFEAPFTREGRAWFAALLALPLGCHRRLPASCVPGATQPDAGTRSYRGAR